MGIEFDSITGTLQYKDIDFFFTFNGNNLKLIPPEDKKETIEFHWINKEIKNNVYVPNDDLLMDDPYLIGKCDENGHDIIFITKYKSFIASKNSTLFVDVIGYIDFKGRRNSISEVLFECPELDYIYDNRRAFQLQYEDKKVKSDYLHAKTPVLAAMCALAFALMYAPNCTNVCTSVF